MTTTVHLFCNPRKREANEQRVHVHTVSAGSGMDGRASNTINTLANLTRHFSVNENEVKVSFASWFYVQKKAFIIKHYFRRSSYKTVKERYVNKSSRLGCPE